MYLQIAVIGYCLLGISACAKQPGYSLKNYFFHIEIISKVKQYTPLITLR
jgi:hypothetical protein